MPLALVIALLASHDVWAAAAHHLEQSMNWTRHPGVEFMLF